MSEIRATTISDAAGTGPATLTGQSAAKAWVNFSQATPAILDSLNTSSLTDTSLGIGNLNWTSAMSDTNYAVSTGVNSASPNTAYTATIVDDSPTSGREKTVSVYYYQSTYSHATYADYGDPKFGVLSVNGDLA